MTILFHLIILNTCLEVLKDCFTLDLKGPCRASLVRMGTTELARLAAPTINMAGQWAPPSTCSRGRVAGPERAQGGGVHQWRSQEIKIGEAEV